jgi:hypothetical protein
MIVDGSKTILKSGINRMRLVIVVPAEGRVAVIEVSVLHQEAHVFAKLPRQAGGNSVLG